MLLCTYIVSMVLHIYDTFNPWRWASELRSTFDIKKPVAYSRPPRNENPNAGAALRGRSRRTTRTRLSVAPAVISRDTDVAVDVLDAAYIAT